MLPSKYLPIFPSSFNICTHLPPDINFITKISLHLEPSLEGQVVLSWATKF